MEFEPLKLDGCFLIRPRVFHDARGRFVKTLLASALQAHRLRADFVEQYYSTSARGVVRGMHFQLPPHDHAKLVYCAAGAVTDVLLDLRRDQPTYGEHVAIELDAEGGAVVYIAPGVAHGFVAVQEPALMVYNVTSEYAPTHDAGIRWDSFGFDWGVQAPVMSERDRSFPAFVDFVSSF